MMDGPLLIEGSVQKSIGPAHTCRCGPAFPAGPRGDWRTARG